MKFNMESKTIIILLITSKCTLGQLKEIYTHITNFLGTRNIIDYGNTEIFHIIGIKFKFEQEDVEEVLKELSSISSEILDSVEIFDVNKKNSSLKLIS